MTNIPEGFPLPTDNRFYFNDSDGNRFSAGVYLSALEKWFEYRKHNPSIRSDSLRTKE